VIALISGALFRGVSWIAPSCYFIGIAAIVCSGAILKKTKTFSSAPTPFVMELPSYHAPVLKNVLSRTWDKGKDFIRKAGTVIFVACGLIWFLSTFNYALQIVEAQESMLASLGNLIAPIFAPLGWGNWQAVVAALTGLAAKENVVGTLRVLYGHDALAENNTAIWAIMQAAFSQLSAYSFLVFNLLCAPCAAAMATIAREMGNAKWTIFAIGYQTGLAYLVSFAIYQTGLFFAGYGFQPLTAVAFLLIAVFLFLLFRPAKYVRTYKSAAPPLSN
jgi:ferrous iron transport protein B